MIGAWIVGYDTKTGETKIKFDLGEIGFTKFPVIPDLGRRIFFDLTSYQLGFDSVMGKCYCDASYFERNIINFEGEFDLILRFKENER